MKRPFFLLTILLSCVAGWAQKISQQEAAEQAIRFLCDVPATRADKSQLDHKLVPVDDPQLDNCYVFVGADEKGFVIVSDGSEGESCVLGWSDTDRYDAGNVPPALQDWINGQHTPHAMTGNSKGNVVVGPLLKTNWGQGDYFNLLCPTVNGSQCLAGCVAIALAQVMYYYRWPETGAGSISYFDQRSNQQISVDFSKSTYNWDAMPVKYDYYNAPSQEQQLAVATLVRDAGAACQMMYSPSGSAAVVQIQNCYKYLKYTSTARYMYRNSYTATEWKNAIETELDAGRPVLYGGYNESSGHAFVADGYDDMGYMHINWGWFGSCNGYFLSNEMYPYGGTDDHYNLSQHIIVGFMPDKNWEQEEEEEDEEQPAQTFSWDFNSDKGILTISGTGDMPYTYTAVPWDSYKNKIKKVVIKNGVTNVPDRLFENRLTITELELPSSMVSIGEYAFYGCRLTNVELPSKIKQLSRYAFYGNELQNIFIPASLTEFDGSAFAGNYKLGAYVVDRDNPKFCTEDNILYDKRLTKVISCPPMNESISLPSTVTEYGSSAFSNCYFTTFIVPEAITTMGEYALSGQSRLRKLIFQNDITTLPASVCAGCYRLERVELPANLEIIRERAFQVNTSLSSITLPATLNTIFYRAFYGCEQLSHIRCLATTAPSVTSATTFQGIAENGILTVPIGSDYSSWLALLPAGWTIEYDDFSGIETVNSDASAAATYDLQGRRVDAATKGIHIVGGRKYWQP